jgi:hypothetical protein
VGSALLVEMAGLGALLARAFLCARLLGLRLGDGAALAFALAALGLADGWTGCVFDACAAAVVAAEWFSRFMNPTTPTVLSSVARQVSLDNRRRPSSRCAPRRSRCFMSPYEIGERVKRPPRTNQGVILFGRGAAPGATGLVRASRPGSDRPGAGEAAVDFRCE